MGVAGEIAEIRNAILESDATIQLVARQKQTPEGALVRIALKMKQANRALLRLEKKLFGVDTE